MPHDVATILRRYLTQMPEPIIPLELYHEFRDALDKPNPNPEEVIPVYKSLIGRMPKPNQYLLLYVLDLLSVFAKKSDQNLMTSSSRFFFLFFFVSETFKSLLGPTGLIIKSSSRRNALQT